MNILDNIIDSKEAAELWDLSQSHVKLLCNQGLIKAKKIGNSWAIDATQPNPKKYRLEGLEEKKMYMKNKDTGAVKTMAEWTEIAIREFTEVFNEDESLQEEFESLQAYLKWAEQRGQLYVDLAECDKNGNLIDYLEG
ncbi:hypothetical protein QH639_20140 [Lysinibacillus sp. 1 U-2021]|uniref:hypothetical protein n=1 Tax=Lysinibacillus sp. 1 U-2021 TaxID=3039426 RepID=UPI002480F061|nr:hypothetical protein [Lysinibacillus sp. 1 U-2021]WGT38110.1 hypothetical protein QH639_20140 [Lysinibacillus sp. 1 U-2021]